MNDHRAGDAVESHNLPRQTKDGRERDARRGPRAGLEAKSPKRRNTA